MLTSQRKDLILDMLRREGQVVAKRAAEEFSLSEDTIRRDLREMAADGLLRRVHGGAMPISPDLPDLSARRVISSEVKRKLGAAAAGMVKPGQLIFLDGGTSTAEIARALPRSFAFTVATHSPTIAAELEHHPTAEVILIGGRLYKHSMVAVGAMPISQISLIRPDIFFLGATAIHPSRGLSTGDLEEAAVKRHIASRTAETFVLVTDEKLDASSPCTIMPISDLAGMIVQSGLGEERLAPYRALELEIIEA
ncbi:DeoR/GlpR family DNA-binding transcription regulator [Rhizobium sp. LC145]|uniref:DeoR/GlpR family DNA-binding transcription regulator n=1 Tax=Rhizobium sp. LC145 TaxID=1120688 RepID=UPI00062A084A|nr:DeoR/GlpR family DNA-binding transcription regulator [Rhizobium sp. LC145]KKX28178.1 DeoR faimly transcriptional regulator [Rhizobium sp. LC145]TKT46234.1 DeoR/GlpR transcriptional regulator [Rhizobiaceae bacterium LC148]